MTVTDELQALLDEHGLDEHGIKHFDYDKGGATMTAHVMTDAELLERMWPELCRQQPKVPPMPEHDGTGCTARLVRDGRLTRCSECGCRVSRAILRYCELRYCPNCGARMEVQR